MEQITNESTNPISGLPLEEGQEAKLLVRNGLQVPEIGNESAPAAWNTRKIALIGGTLLALATLIGLGFLIYHFGTALVANGSPHKVPPIQGTPPVHANPGYRPPVHAG